jgi:hypothetical protein
LTPCSSNFRAGFALQLSATHADYRITTVASTSSMAPPSNNYVPDWQTHQLAGDVLLKKLVLHTRH